MKKVLILHLDQDKSSETISFLGQPVTIDHIGCGGDLASAEALIKQYDGQVDAIGLEGMPFNLRLGGAQRPHEHAAQLRAAAQQTPLVDGSGIRAGLERWGITLAGRAQPGIFGQKRVLMVPGLNHSGMAQALKKRSVAIRYADPAVYFALPSVLGVGNKYTLEQAAAPTLERLKDAPYRRIEPQAGSPGTPRYTESFHWADVLAGSIGAIRRYAPHLLTRKIVVVEFATEEDIADLRERGVSILITLMPSLTEDSNLGRWSSATIEAVLVALREDPDQVLNEDTYLDLMSEMDWSPAVRMLQPDEANLNKFAFVIHPLSMKFIHNHPLFKWTRYLPNKLVEPIAAFIPPMKISRITGGQSPTTGQRIEGLLVSLGATPRQMVNHNPRFTYDRLNQAALMGERYGARIMGLGAFTSVVGDAGITVAHESEIAITSGNSLTVAATLEAAKQAVVKMGATDLTKGKAMVIGATGSIGSVCSRLLAQAIYDVVLVSIEPERLIELKRLIQAETPGAKVSIGTRPDDYLPECDLIITATSAFGQRIVDVSKCKPGAVICDVARPADINPAEAALRPDILVIESGEVLIPGNIDFGYNIGLPPKTAYACLAETALLAMEGHFEDYTLGRDISPERVKEIYRLFKKHQFKIAGLRSFEEFLTDEGLAEKRAIAEQYRNDPELFERVRNEAGEKIAKMPVMAKGVGSSGNSTSRYAGLAVAAAGAAAIIGAGSWLRGRRQKESN